MGRWEPPTFLLYAKPFIHFRSPGFRPSRASVSLPMNQPEVGPSNDFRVLVVTNGIRSPRAIEPRVLEKVGYSCDVRRAPHKAADLIPARNFRHVVTHRHGQ